MATGNTSKAKPSQAGKGLEKPNKKDSGATRPSSTSAKSGSGQSKSTSKDKGAATETPGSTRKAK